MKTRGFFIMILERNLHPYCIYTHIIFNTKMNWLSKGQGCFYCPQVFDFTTPLKQFPYYRCSTIISIQPHNPKILLKSDVLNYKASARSAMYDMEDEIQQVEAKSIQNPISSSSSGPSTSKFDLILVVEEDFSYSGGFKCNLTVELKSAWPLVEYTDIKTQLPILPRSNFLFNPQPKYCQFRNWLKICTPLQFPTALSMTHYLYSFYSKVSHSITCSLI